jgi:hypothetical protein
VALSARQWREFYAAERDALGHDGLVRAVRRASAFSLAPRGAVVFPHTRLSTSGRLAAAAARAVVLSGADRVLAIGVLHGARERDADTVRRARAGDPEATEALRRVHGPGAPLDRGHANEEFSLDGFRALIAAAAEAEGRSPPAIVERYPFLVGDDPASLPGMGELETLVEKGACLVATADPVHHGIGYETPADQALPASSPSTVMAARGWVEDQLSALADRRYSAFRTAALRVRSDFRDGGPVLAHLLGVETSFVLRDFELVSYADVLSTPEPTWVGAALASFVPKPGVDRL